MSLKVDIFCGKSSDTVAKSLGSKGSFKITSHPDVEAGLNELLVTGDSDKVMVFDMALKRDGRVLDASTMFSAFRNLARNFPSIDIIFVTKIDKFQSIFENTFLDSQNCRCVFTEKISAGVLYECVMGRDPNVVSAVQPEVTATDLKPVSVVEVAPPVEPVRAPEPEPEPVVEEKPRREKYVEEKPKKKEKKGLFSRQEKLYERVRRSKVVAITGNDLSGVTSLASELANVANSEFIKTILIDTDYMVKGVNMYYDNLDVDVSNRQQKSGLSFALNSVFDFDDAKCKVGGALDIIGLESSFSPVGIHETIKDSSLLCDIVSVCGSEYLLTLVHIPFYVLQEVPELVKEFDNVIYCSRSTINGLENMRKNLVYKAEISPELGKINALLKRKIDVVLCDYDAKNSKQINIGNYIACLDDLNGKPVGVRVLSTVSHYEGFDNFKTTKTLRSSKEPAEYRSILESLLCN